MCQICDETYFLSNRQRIQLNKDLNIDGLVGKAINQLYDDRKIDKKTKAELLKSHYEPLKQAVNEGYTAKVEFGTPNYEFLKQLQTNTAVFATFKNHSSIKEMAALLKDKDGNLRTREDFKTEALKIDKDYRTTKLDAEYDTAVRTARMAANWQKIEKNKRLYPNLKYLLTKAANPDEKHKQYVGIIRPVDDPFWNAHYPPNRWRCQCSVEQVDDDVTDIPNNLPPVPKDFAFNAGKQSKIFDLENSEYIKNVPPKEQPKLIKEAKKIVNVEAAKDAPYQTLYSSKTGTDILLNPLGIEAPDFNEIVNGARKLANSKLDTKVIKILPYLKNDKDDVLRNVLMPEGVKGKHNPEYEIDGRVTDLKTPRTNKYKALEKLLEKCYEQCNNIYLDLEDTNFNSGMVQNFFKGKFKAGYSKMETVIVNYNGDFKIFTREEILKGKWV